MNLFTTPEKCHRTILWNADLVFLIEVVLFPSNSEWLRRNLEAKDVLPNKPHAGRRKCRFLSLVTLTFDFDLQTRLSEGPNTPSVWIWRKSIHWFPGYFIRKQKTNRQQNGAKAEPWTGCGRQLLCCIATWISDQQYAGTVKSDHRLRWYTLLVFFFQSSIASRYSVLAFTRLNKLLMQVVHSLD